MNLPTTWGRDINQLKTSIGWSPLVVGSGQQTYRLAITLRSIYNTPPTTLYAFSVMNNVNNANNVKNIGLYADSGFTSLIQSFTNGAIDDKLNSTQMFTLKQPYTGSTVYVHIIVNSITEAVMISNFLCYVSSS
jgi:hypothetical protein